MEHEELMWLAFAKTDLGVAKHLDKEYSPKPLEVICYHCQQAAEKAVKSIIIASAGPEGIPKKHNLSFLLEKTKGYVSIPEVYFDYADTLTPYGIAVRYPNELHIEESHVQEALKAAQDIVSWADKIINKEVSAKLPKKNKK